MNYRYVLIRSWHVIAYLRFDGDAYVTRCGRTAKADAETSDVLPGTGKSCETCTRQVLRDEDKS